MADRLYLSYWLRGYTEHNMLRHFSAMLHKFPFSALSPRAVLRTYAIELVEPPIAEREFAGQVDVDALLAAAAEFHQADCAYEIETAWDLWQFEDEWKIKPSELTLSCYGPLFPSELGEQLRIDFGLDAQFLPRPEIPAGLAPVRHNIQSLLHLVRDLDAALPVDKRRLWSESGENFAARLQAALAADAS